MRLHEIELFAKDPQTSGDVFSNLLNLKLNVDQPALKVFNAGVEGLDLNVSNHYENKVSLSFLAKDVDEYYKMMLEKNVSVSEPYDSHLGMRAMSYQIQMFVELLFKVLVMHLLSG